MWKKEEEREKTKTKKESNYTLSLFHRLFTIFTIFVGHFIWKHVFHFKWKAVCRHDKHAILRSSRCFLRRFYASFCCHVVVAWLSSVSISSLFGYLWLFSVVLCFLACFTPLLHSSYCKLPFPWFWTHFLKMHCFFCLRLLRRGIDCWVQASQLNFKQYKNLFRVPQT